MGPFGELLSKAGAEMSSLRLWDLLPRMLTAVTIGAVLSLRPWRWLLKRPLPKSEMIQAQILLCAAASVITVVIGDSLAKAFGLVGLGGFVRFRSGLKDPRDAAVLFLMIGLGMACGHGALNLAAVGAAFAAVLLCVLDLAAGKEAPKPQRIRLSAQAEDPNAAEGELRRLLTENEVVVKGCTLDFGTRRIEIDAEETRPGQVAAACNRTAHGLLEELRWTAVSPKPGREEL